MSEKITYIIFIGGGILYWILTLNQVLQIIKGIIGL
jgi:hypothetical protein